MPDSMPPCPDDDDCYLYVYVLPILGTVVYWPKAQNLVQRYGLLLYVVSAGKYLRLPKEINWEDRVDSTDIAMSKAAVLMAVRSYIKINPELVAAFDIPELRGELEKYLFETEYEDLGKR